MEFWDSGSARILYNSFSQGAVCASILCSMNTKEPTAENPISFKFAILVSGFPPRYAGSIVS